MRHQSHLWTLFLLHIGSAWAPPYLQMPASMTQVDGLTLT